MHTIVGTGISNANALTTKVIKAKHDMQLVDNSDEQQHTAYITRPAENDSYSRNLNWRNAR
jgi:hypothetical protein